MLLFQITLLKGTVNMTIKEFCIKYNCNKAGVYKKIKRKETDLEDHIKNENGIIHIDEIGEEILKPGDRQRELKALIEKGKMADWNLERAEGRYNIEKANRRKASDEYAALQIDYKRLQEALDEERKEKETLLAQISELKQRCEELERKHKGIFGRR